MDALSALASIATSNAIAGVGAPGSTTPTGGTQLPDPASPVAPATSASVFLSELAQGLLAQQASDPTLDIDTAFAQTLLGQTPGSTSNGQLYTSTGLLQPFVANQPGATDTQTPPDTVGVVEQAALTSEQSLVDGTTTPPANSIAAQPVTVPAVAVSNVTDTQVSAATTGTTQQAAASDTTDATDATATADTTTAASTQVTNADNGVVIPPATSSAGNVDPTTSDIRDPYQQAALASGVSAFGKELNGFVPAAADDVQSIIQGIAAIRPVGAIGSRGNESTEFWLNARR